MISRFEAHTFADSLHGADLAAIFHSMKGEIDLGDGLLLVDCMQGLVDLDLLDAMGRERDASVHDRRGMRRRKYASDQEIPLSTVVVL